MSSDQLRNLLCEETEALRNEALQNRGQISDEKVKTLEHLVQLMEVSDKLRPPKARKRWPVAAILGICLVVVSVLLFARLRSTEVELDLKLTDVHFMLSREVLLIKGMTLSALGGFDLQEIQVPNATKQGAGDIIRLSVVETEKEEPLGIINLRDLLLPAGTNVWVSSTEVPNQYRLSLELPKGAEVDIQVNVKGLVQVARGGSVEQIEYSTPDKISMQPASQRVTFDLRSLGGTQEAFSSYLPSQDLSFIRIEEYKDTDKTYIRHVPTILLGTIYFAELNGQKSSLREGEDLQFEQSDGQIRSLKLEKNQLALKFHGYVSGMTTGWEKIRVNLMPTWLAWLRARHGLGLLWGTMLFLFGVVNQVIRWWKRG